MKSHRLSSGITPHTSNQIKFNSKGWFIIDFTLIVSSHPTHSSLHPIMFFFSNAEKKTKTSRSKRILMIKCIMPIEFDGISRRYKLKINTYYYSFFLFIKNNASLKMKYNFVKIEKEWKNTILFSNVTFLSKQYNIIKKSWKMLEHYIFIVI